MSDQKEIEDLQRQVSKLVDRLDWVMLSNNRLIALLQTVLIANKLDRSVRFEKAGEIPTDILDSIYQRISKMIDESFAEQGIGQNRG